MNLVAVTATSLANVLSTPHGVGYHSCKCGVPNIGIFQTGVVVVNGRGMCWS